MSHDDTRDRAMFHIDAGEVLRSHLRREDPVAFEGADPKVHPLRPVPGVHIHLDRTTVPAKSCIPLGIAVDDALEPPCCLVHVGGEGDAIVCIVPPDIKTGSLVKLRDTHREIQEQSASMASLVTKKMPGCPAASVPSK